MSDAPKPSQGQIERAMQEAGEVHAWLSRRLKAYGPRVTPFTLGTALVQLGVDTLLEAGYEPKDLRAALGVSLDAYMKRVASEGPETDGVSVPVN